MASARSNMTDSGVKPALIQAVQDNAFSLLTSLIDAGADVDLADTNHKTALIYAVCSDNDGFVGELIAAGADLNKSDIDRKIALIHAVENNKEARAFALIKAGADANITDNERKTALFYAVQQSNNESVVGALIDDGADVNRTDNEGKTALFYAVQSNNESVVRALIDLFTNTAAILNSIVLSKKLRAAEGVIIGKLIVCTAFRLLSVNKAERNNDDSSTIRIILPFKDQVAANAVRKQLRDLSHKIGPTLQPVFVSKKLGQDLKPKEIKPSIVNRQCVVYHFSCDLCVMQIMSGTQPDTFINALLSTRIRQLVDIS